MNNIQLTTDPKYYNKILQIGKNMNKSGLQPEFVHKIVSMALEYEGVFDLMYIWDVEQEQDEKNKVISDLYEIIDDHYNKKDE